MITLRLLDKFTAAKIRDGDIQAFEALINKFKTRIFNYCLHIVTNYHIAEEITQEVFIKVYEGIDLYDSQKASLSTWMFTIAHNTCINSFRNTNKETSLNEIVIQTKNISVEDQIIIKDYLYKLNEVIQSLSPKDKSLIIMKDYIGLKYSEISKIMNLPEGTVKSGLHSIRLKIRKLIGDYYD